MKLSDLSPKQLNEALTPERALSLIDEFFETAGWRGALTTSHSSDLTEQDLAQATMDAVLIHRRPDKKEQARINYFMVEQVKVCIGNTVGVFKQLHTAHEKLVELNFPIHGDLAEVLKAASLIEEKRTRLTNYLHCVDQLEHAIHNIKTIALNGDDEKKELQSFARAVLKQLGIPVTT